MNKTIVPKLHKDTLVDLEGAANKLCDAAVCVGVPCYNCAFNNGEALKDMLVNGARDAEV